MEDKFLGLLALMLIVAAVCPSLGALVTSANITNVAPSIMSVSAYPNYTNCTSNTLGSAFFYGSNGTVYVQANVSDANGYGDITDNGYVKFKIVVFNGSSESDFARFGANYTNATFESGSGVHAIYIASFNMTSNDSTKFGDVSPAGYYRVKVSVSDGTNVTTSNLSAAQNANYTYVNATPVVIVSAFDGSTTDISAVDVHNITNLVLEKTSYGKINFTSTVNFTQTVNLSSTINLTDNFVSIDSVAHPELNKSATISFYNLTLSDPMILRNGVVCPSSICTKISYSGGVLVFNVTGFTNYSSAEAWCGDGSCNGGESCSSCSADCGSCPLPRGGGGGCTTDWVCGAWSVCSNGVQSRSCSKNLSYCAARQMPETERNCTAGQVLKAANVDDSVGEKVVVREHALFDIGVNMANDKLFIYEKLIVTVSLLNIGKAGKVPVTINYTVLDGLGNVVYKEEELLVVETQLQFVKEFDVSQLREGMYSFAADLGYGDQTEPARAEGKFYVKATIIPTTGEITAFVNETQVMIVVAFGILVVVYFVLVEKKRVFGRVGQKETTERQ